MAIGYAECTCATCGETFTMRAEKQNRRSADSWAEWAKDNYTECSDCYRARRKKEREEQNSRAAAEAAEMGWPELTGSEKQVAWANTIREQMMGYMQTSLDQGVRRLTRVREKDDAEMVEKWTKQVELMRGIMDWLLETKTKASYWIDHRSYLQYEYTKREIEAEWISEWEASEHQAEPDEAAEAAAREEVTLVPEDQTHTGTVDITVTGDAVRAIYVKEDDFRTLVKGLGYRWNKDISRWEKAITVTTGTAQERAAELGNRLLNAGYAVRIEDEDTRQAAVQGRYEPEIFRWVAKKGEAFFITWGRQDDFYGKAISINKSRYSKPGVMVPASEWAEVEDFARTHGFRLTPGAEDLIRAQKGETVVVAPAEPKEPTYDEHDPADILTSSADVLDDLKEEI